MEHFLNVDEYTMSRHSQDTFTLAELRLRIYVSLCCAVGAAKQQSWFFGDGTRSFWLESERLEAQREREEKCGDGRHTHRRRMLRGWAVGALASSKRSDRSERNARF